MRKKIIGPLLALFFFVHATTAVAPSGPRVITNFEPVVIPSAKIIHDNWPDPRPTMGTQPKQKKIPQPIIKELTPPTPKPDNGDHKLSGVASWYCLAGVSRCTYTHSGGMYAAIRKDLLFLRGKTIGVCTNDNCIRVTVIDCNCGVNANLIDLYSDAFRQLAPLSQGRVKVYITW